MCVSFEKIILLIEEVAEVRVLTAFGQLPSSFFVRLSVTLPLPLTASTRIKGHYHRVSWYHAAAS